MTVASLVQDARLGLRMLGRAPLYTWTVIATLALGIGGTSAIFSVLYAVVLRPIPIDAPAQVDVVRASFASVKLESISLSPREFLDVEAAIAKLPPGARRVFVLHDVEGYKHDEIAEQLGVTTGATKAQLHRARLLLREALKR